MVYLSTCAVFNGQKRFAYTEADKPNPISVYGKTKLQGELIILKLLPDALIIRTSWLFGSNVKTNKKFFQIAKEGLKKGKTITGITDRLGSPTYIPDLLETLQKLIIKNSSGIFHVTNSGLASYFDIVKEMKRVGKFKGSVIPQKYLLLKNIAVKRGKMEGLNSKKIKLRSWKAAIKNYVLNN
jgi:dTDP-4-dehydrorhamnose reductase